MAQIHASDQSHDINHTDIQEAINSWRAEARSGISGLLNQGGTCYLNTLLQTLLHTPDFTNRLFAMARQVSVSKLKRIIQELLILFSRLHAGKGEAVSSKHLTDSFGWNGEEVFVHQDIQELNRLLFEQIEIALKNTGQQNLINDLYHGVLRTRIKCLVCGRVSERNDDFLDVNLSVSDCDSVEESLRAHTQTERLCGDNQYFCERCQCRVDASKFSRFTDLPPILTLSLSRFYYDAKSMEARKLDKLCSFPMQLDMADFVAENYTKEVLYDLFSVVIHVGNTACGGHYHAYIKDPYGVFNGGVRSSKQRFEAKIVNQANTNSSCTRDRRELTDCRRGRYVCSNTRVARQDTILPRRSLSLARTLGEPDSRPPIHIATQQAVFPAGLADSSNHATTSACRRQAMFTKRACQKPSVGTTGQPLRVSHLVRVWSSSSNKGSALDFVACPHPLIPTALPQREMSSTSGYKGRKSHSVARDIQTRTFADSLVLSQKARQGERLADRMKAMCLGGQKASTEVSPNYRSRKYDPRSNSQSQHKLCANSARRSGPKGGAPTKQSRHTNSRAPPTSILTSPEISDQGIVTRDEIPQPSSNCLSSDIESDDRRACPKALTTSHNNGDDRVMRTASNEHFDPETPRTTVWRSKLFAQATPGIVDDMKQEMPYLQRHRQSHASTMFLQDISDRSDTAASSGQEEAAHGGRVGQDMPSRGVKMKDSLSINFGMTSIIKARRTRNQGHNSEQMRSRGSNISSASSVDIVTPPPPAANAVEYGKWFDFNDDVVTEVDVTAFSGVFQGPECAYMLFYKVNPNPV